MPELMGRTLYLFTETGKAACAVDQDGNPVERNKWDHPYSYDPFVLWGDFTGKSFPDQNCIYTDRMYSWNPEKFKDLCEKWFKKPYIGHWDNLEPAEIEGFLKDFLDKPNLILFRIMECCHLSRGYPIWMLFYHLEG